MLNSKSVMLDLGLIVTLPVFVYMYRGFVDVAWSHLTLNSSPMFIPLQWDFHKRHRQKGVPHVHSGVQL